MSKSDDLLKGAKALLDEMSPKEEKKEPKASESETPSWLEGKPEWLKDSFNAVADGYKKIEPALATGFNIVAWPLKNTVWPALKWSGARYAEFFKWGTWKPDAETGDPKFSRQGFSAVMATTAVLAGALYFGTGPAVHYTGRFIYDNAMSVTTAEQELYIVGAETIVEGESYSIKASTTLPATEESTIHFHVEEDLSLLHWNFYPEDIYDAVPQETSWGKIEATGFRVKFLDWYPEIKSIEVTPLNELPTDHPARMQSGAKTGQPQASIEHQSDAPDLVASLSAHQLPAKPQVNVPGPYDLTM